MHDVRRLPVGEGIEEIAPALDELAREGARRMIAAGLRAEADEYVERFSGEVDEDGHRLVVRNGRARERKVTVGSGTIPIKAPRVNDKRVDEEGARQKISSRILPAYARRSPKVGEVIPILYLRGLSAGVFRHLKRRGLNEPKLVVGDGALGAWAALRDVYPGAREQRCWFHASGNIIDCLPKRLHSRAKGLLGEIIEAPTRRDAKHALEVFREEYGAKYPKALAKLDRDWTQLTALYDYPAEHWRHLRTTNPIESAFATVRLRTRVTKGAGSNTAALAMAYKLLESAQERWRRFNGHHLVADVLDGVKFKDGIKVTDDDNHDDGMTDERVAA